MITVKAFCQKYDVTHQTVYKKIKRKWQILKEHIFKKDNLMMLDEYAENLLKPYSSEVEFREKNNFLQIQLLEKNKKIENLTEEINYQKREILQLEDKLKNSGIEILHLRELVNDFEKSQTATDDKSTEKKKSVFGKLEGIMSKK